MKLPPFEYVCPTSIGEAAHLLASSEGDARIISGGQSLLPVMAFRLAAPSLLIDLAAVPELRSVSVGPNEIHIGAMVRWRDISNDQELRAAFPLLHEAVSHVAHYQIQNRGTVGGSLAHADPAAEFPGIVATCDAVIEIVNVTGSRDIPAKGFFMGPMQTCLDDGDIIVGIRFPMSTPTRRWAFEEFSRRKGDFALAAIILFYDQNADGHAENAHIGVIGATDMPRRLPNAEAVLNGQRLDDSSILAVAEAASKEVNAPSDLHGSSRYRKSLVATLVKRCLQKTKVQIYGSDI